MRQAMRLAALGVVALAVATSGSGLPARGTHTRTSQADLARTRAAYARLPLGFEPNRGQAPRNVDFVARGRGYTILVGDARTTVELGRGPSRRSISLALAGARHARPAAHGTLPG